jgi:hypothetical protein
MTPALRHGGEDSIHTDQCTLGAVPLVRRAISSRAENEHGRLRNLSCSMARLMAAVTAGLADIG